MNGAGRFRYDCTVIFQARNRSIEVANNVNKARTKNRYINLIVMIWSLLRIVNIAKRHLL